MDFVTHYYRIGDPPFRSLSLLSDSEALRVAEKFQNETALVYRRFKKLQSYWTRRRATEKWLRDEFIKKGGEPHTDHPQYLVLGTSKYIFEGYDQNCHQIRIPLSAFSEKEISFTYPDSMVSLWLLEQQDQEYFHPEYHGQVFTLPEIESIVERYGIPDQEWDTDPKRTFDLFIEAQVWNPKVLEKYID